MLKTLNSFPVVKRLDIKVWISSFSQKEHGTLSLLSLAAGGWSHIPVTVTFRHDSAKFTSSQVSKSVSAFHAATCYFIHGTV